MLFFRKIANQTRFSVSSWSIRCCRNQLRPARTRRSRTSAGFAFKTLNSRRCPTRDSACPCTSRGPPTWWRASSCTRVAPGTHRIVAGCGFTRPPRNPPRRRLPKFKDNTVFTMEVKQNPHVLNSLHPTG